MKITIIYYITGVVVSIYHIWYYRYSKDNQQPKKSDSLLAIIGPWIWPLQIIKHIIDRTKK